MKTEQRPAFEPGISKGKHGFSVNLGVAKWLFDIYTSVDIKS
jgi:hypothetical protein